MGGLNYKVVKKTFGFDKDGTEKYVAEAVRGGTVSFEKVIEQISLRSGISKATCRSTGCMKKETAHQEQPSRVRKERTREEEVSINHFLIHF